ncbi:MAG TPA: xanthine dehydrogenase family protein molybdopterin-binding subunit, partial [Feifaniaceae bacterium]|nr:xanthine dehydrogenase family protein molybdopterin-binding subunit [Feifaniaceae bacterium]
MNTAIGTHVTRQDAWDKAAGRAVYTDDLPGNGTAFARLLTSPHAHANIERIDTKKAEALPGVLAVLTGYDCPSMVGPLLQDRPILAREKARYAGEPVALVVAREESIAARALGLIEVVYTPLPLSLTPSQSLNADAPRIHENPKSYRWVKTDIYPVENSNIASEYRILKGDAKNALAMSGIVITKRFFLPPSAHAAMETHCAEAEIKADGTVVVSTSSQAPYAVRAQLAETFALESGKIEVRTPFVGGGFGGKAPVALEYLAYLASKRLNGQKVRVTLPREEEFHTVPCRMGLEAELTLGANREGVLQGAELCYWVDCGAYSDSAPYMAKAIAADCTGPYDIPHVLCNAYCVYTNHTFATSYRGFGHDSLTFCVERTMDALAGKLNMDPLVLRQKNAIRPGGETPTQVAVTGGNTGDLPACLRELKSLANWESGRVVPVKENTVRAQGTACFWKCEVPPPNAVSGALVTPNPDGSFNLNTGVVEIGSGGQTLLAQLFAEKLQMEPSMVHVSFPADTRLNPEHWKTAASMTAHMAGSAVCAAADDIISQLKRNGALALGCKEEEIEVAHARVYQKSAPEQFIPFKDIVSGYQAKDGSTMGEPALGRGSFLFKGLTPLDEFSGKGRPGPSWSVGAQAVEVEVDTKEYTYRILSAATVMDIGRALDPEIMRAVIAGGMAMGVSMATREAFDYDAEGRLTTPTLRTYKLLHIGQEPEYRVGFVETPEEHSPYGVRKFSEHGVIGMPAAIANALSAALGKPVDTLPLTPER